MFALIDDLIRPVKNHLLTIFFIGGFVVDNLTLNQVDQLFDNAVLAGYVVLAMLSLLYLYWGTSGKLSERIAVHAGKWAPLMIQFAFGGLMSGLLVFYSRSGSWWTSWPYLILMLGVIVGNELIKKRGERLIFNLSIFFVGLFSYTVLILPVVIGRMGDIEFVGSGFIALVIFALFLKLLYLMVPNFMALHTRMVFFSIGMIYVTLNGLYFANVIPPIPLSMKEMGIFHEVTKRAEGGYVLTYEKGPWYAFWHTSDTTFHYTDGSGVFCYASIFAPARLKTGVVHRWEYYDADRGEWVKHSTIPYAIDGGRDLGYRGFSVIKNVREGKWRCSAETARGQVVGQVTFELVREGAPRPLTTRVDM